MKSWRRPMLGLTFIAVAGLAGLLGTALLDHVSVAQAQQKLATPSQKELATIQDLSAVFRDVAHEVEPSVVNINVTRTVKTQGTPMDDQLLRRFFHDDINRNDAPVQTVDSL